MRGDAATALTQFAINVSARELTAAAVRRARLRGSRRFELHFARRAALVGFLRRVRGIRRIAVVRQICIAVHVCDDGRVLRLWIMRAATCQERLQTIEAP
jgi:hypothetical protein